jgi:SET domain-containing protein
MPNYTQAVKVGPSSIHGRGVIASKAIPKGAVIGAVFRARRHSRARGRGPADQGVLVQMTRMGSMVNHSDNPTAGLYRVVEMPYEVHYLVTLKDVLPEEELCADYDSCPFYVQKPQDLGFRYTRGPMRGFGAEAQWLGWRE